ncbi:MAG: molybdopterin-binding protein [bacterium]|nr:molybdopterin-binding protein [bacterium]
MDLGLVIIGDEILTGRRADQHFSHVVKSLSRRSMELAWVYYLGDDEASLVRHFREIKKRGDLCFSFGGIGATPDDRTRQAVARAHDVPIARHPDAVAEIEARFGQDAYPIRVLMADLPRGARLIPNTYNRIPGFSMGHIHCVPGFPELAWPMVEWVLDNQYGHLSAKLTVQHELIVAEALESQLVELLQRLQKRHDDVKISSLPRFLPDGGREVALGVRGEAPEAAAALEDLERELKAQRFSVIAGPSGAPSEVGDQGE